MSAAEIISELAKLTRPEQRRWTLVCTNCSSGRPRARTEPPRIGAKPLLRWQVPSMACLKTSLSTTTTTCTARRSGECHSCGHGLFLGSPQCARLLAFAGECSRCPSTRPHGHYGMGPRRSRRRPFDPALQGKVYGSCPDFRGAAGRHNCCGHPRAFRPWLRSLCGPEGQVLDPYRLFVVRRHARPGPRFRIDARPALPAGGFPPLDDALKRKDSAARKIF
jgi:hypothetical protein